MRRYSFTLNVRQCLWLALVGLCAVVLASCEYGIQKFLYRDATIDSRCLGAPNTVDSPTDKAEYTVAVITDVHFGKDELERFDDQFISRLSESTPEFVLCLGDVVEHGYEEEYIQYAEFVDKVEAKLAEVHGDGKPHHVYTAMGNHDLFNDGWKHWQKYVNRNLGLGSTFYTFRTNTFGWYVVDTGGATLGLSQFEALERKLTQDGGPKIVLTHYPIYGDGKRRVSYVMMQNSNESAYLIDLFARTDVKLVMDGHSHVHREKDFGSFTEVNFPGYLSRRQWGLLHVDESARSLRWEIVDAD